jgi:3-dehydroquinate synthase
MKLKRISIRSSSGTYEVVCGAGALQDAAKEIRALGSSSSVQVVSSPRVWRALGKEMKRARLMSREANVHMFDDRETAKNLESVKKIARSLSRAGADRKSLIVAVGGGVVGDVVGFVAASYLRGVALVQVPTTLVAQVDSAMGGKTGVNLPEGKNLVGAFYPPKLVIADSQLLRTLPNREFRAGLAEVIKYGVIADADLFSYLEKNFDAILRRDAKALDLVISRSAQIKAHVVSRDERESSLREILNFGHTFGHALEKVTRYRHFQHGEAVAWGMVAASLLGHEAGLTRADDVSRVVTLVRRMGVLPAWPRVPEKRLVDAMFADKKTLHGKLRFVLSRRIGEGRSYESVPLHLVERVLHFTPRLMQAVENHLGKLRG